MHNLWSHCFHHQIHTSHRTRMAGLQGLRGKLVGKTTSTWTFLHGLGSHHYISCNLNFSYTFWFEIFIIMFISHSKRINTQSSCIYKKTIKATFRYKNKNTHIPITLTGSKLLSHCFTINYYLIEPTYPHHLLLLSRDRQFLTLLIYIWRIGIIINYSLSHMHTVQGNVR